jgi:hypothetical protein
LKEPKKSAETVLNDYNHYSKGNQARNDNPNIILKQIDHFHLKRNQSENDDEFKELIRQYQSNFSDTSVTCLAPESES